MRLLAYLSFSNTDEKTNIFRSLSIKLVNKKSDYNIIVSEICQKFLLSEKVIFELKEKLNNELKRAYRGKYIFDFCLDEGIPIDKIKAPKKNHDRLTLKMFEVNESFEQTKKNIEKKLVIPSK